VLFLAEGVGQQVVCQKSNQSLWGCIELIFYHGRHLFCQRLYQFTVVIANSFTYLAHGKNLLVLKVLDLSIQRLATRHISLCQDHNPSTFSPPLTQVSEDVHTQYLLRYMEEDLFFLGKVDHSQRAKAYAAAGGDGNGIGGAAVRLNQGQQAFVLPWYR
jgi:hypothetical protein